MHGQCSTNYLVHDRKDAATQVKLSRDLSQCDQFYSKELVNSPLALLQRMVRCYYMVPIVHGIVRVTIYQALL